MCKLCVIGSPAVGTMYAANTLCSILFQYCQDSSLVFKKTKGGGGLEGAGWWEVVVGQDVNKHRFENI